MFKDSGSDKDTELNPENNNIAVPGNDPEASQSKDDEQAKETDASEDEKEATKNQGGLGRGGFFDTSQNIGVFASDELAPERRDFLINYAAERICKVGMSVPAVIALEVARPMSFIGSQIIWGAGPIAAIFVNDRYINEIALLLEDRNNIEELITRIEAIEAVNTAEEKLAKQEAKRKKAEEQAEAEARGEKQKKRWWPFGK